MDGGKKTIWSWLNVFSEWRENRPSHEKKVEMETNTCGKEALFLEVVNRKQVRLSPGRPGGRFDTAPPFCTTAWKLRHLPVIPLRECGVPANGSPHGGNLRVGQRKVRSMRLDSGETMCVSAAHPDPDWAQRRWPVVAADTFRQFFKRMQRFEGIQKVW